VTLIAIPLLALLGGLLSVRAIPEQASAPEIPQDEGTPHATPRVGGKSFVVVTVLLRFVSPQINPDPSYLGSAGVDTDGRPLDGAHRYFLHFAKDELPPAGTRWSLTALETDPFRAGLGDGDGTLGQRGDLLYNPDRSLDIYLQREPPGLGRQANWLRTPERLESAEREATRLNNS
jgi:hypothetical protein